MDDGSQMVADLYRFSQIDVNRDVIRYHIRDSDVAFYIISIMRYIKYYVLRHIFAVDVTVD